MNMEKQILKDIKKYKKQLIAKAKRKGLYENFGEKEERKLENKYGSHYTITDFRRWASNVNDGDLI